VVRTITNVTYAGHPFFSVDSGQWVVTWVGSTPTAYKKPLSLIGLQNCVSEYGITFRAVDLTFVYVRLYFCVSVCVSVCLVKGSSDVFLSFVSVCSAIDRGIKSLNFDGFAPHNESSDEEEGESPYRSERDKVHNLVDTRHASLRRKINQPLSGSKLMGLEKSQVSI
jgi:hypothetical protein